MAEDSSNTMNLDLNLGPGSEASSGSISSEAAVNLEDWAGQPFSRIREAASRRARQRWRWRHSRVPTEAQNLSLELDQLMGNTTNISTLQLGEGSVAPIEEPKTCETTNGFLAEEVVEKKDDAEKPMGSDGSFFDCNICLDLSKDPVVTCCGHLFCWTCLYRWLNVHSDAKECPVCKGEVTTKNVTPIYGRGNGTNNNMHEPEDPSIKVPLRPHARRVEGLRQAFQRNAFGFPVEEMIRRLGHQFDLARDVATNLNPPNSNNERETAERTNTLLNRFLTSRGMRTEQTSLEEVDLNPDIGQTSQLHQSLILRRTQSNLQRPALNTTERLIDVYRNNTRQGVDDRDSFSSIAAVINSESQVDTAMEIDSLVSLSTSSSRRRSENSRASDVDSGDSRAPRRRRLI